MIAVYNIKKCPQHSPKATATARRRNLLFYHLKQSLRGEKRFQFIFYDMKNIALAHDNLKAFLFMNRKSLENFFSHWAFIMNRSHVDTTRDEEVFRAQQSSCRRRREESPSMPATGAEVKVTKLAFVYGRRSIKLERIFNAFCLRVICVYVHNTCLCFMVH